MAPYNHILKDATNVNPFAATSSNANGKMRQPVGYYSSQAETPLHHNGSSAVYGKRHITTPPQSVIRKFSDVLLYSSTPEMEFPHHSNNGDASQTAFFPPSTPTNKHSMGLSHRNQHAYAHSDPQEMAPLQVHNGSLLSPAFSSPQRPMIQHHKLPMIPQAPQVVSSQPADSRSLASGVANSSSVSIGAMSLGANPPKPKKKPSKKEHMPFDVLSEDKPPYSYATLIGMSILSHTEKRLTLSQIYQWIADTFKYYKREEVGWQNSIRHNLSLNKAFVKGEKSKDGKGHFWLIKSGSEEQFLKTKSGRKSAFDEVMDQIKHNNYNHRDLETNASSASSSSSASTSASQAKKKAQQVDTSVKSALAATSFNLPSLPLPESAEYRTSRKRTLDDDDGDDLDEYDVTVADEDERTKEVHTEDDEDNTFIVKRPRIDVSNHDESPHSGPLLASKHLAITSSFSCDSNLELSPVRINTGGPLLEPITPANARLVHVNCILQRTPLITSTAVSASSSVSRLNDQLSASSSIASSLLSAASSLLTTTSYSSHIQKTPTSSGQVHARTPMSSSLGASLLRTPLRKTPTTLVKRLWHNLPGYLDEFYYSPLISSSTLNLYDDDDMILQNFVSPKKDQK